MQRAKKIIQLWLGLNVLFIFALLFGGGREEANWHPRDRNGGGMVW